MLLEGEFVLTLPMELTYTTADAEAGHRAQTFTAALIRLHTAKRTAPSCAMPCTCT